MTAHAFVTHQPRKTCLLGNQLFLIVIFIKVQGHVQAIEQAQIVKHFGQRGSTGWASLGLGRIESRLQSFKNNFAYRQAAIVRVYPFDDVPRGIIATGASNDAFTEADKPVIGFRLLPVERTDTPAVQRVILKGFQAGFHLFFGQVKPKFENHCAFVAQHLFQSLCAIYCLIQNRILENTVDTPLQHLAVPVAKKCPHTPFGRQLSPITPGRRVRQFLVSLRIKRAHFDQARVHPLTQQLYSFAFTRAFNAVNQHNDRRTLLLMKLILSLK